MSEDGEDGEHRRVVVAHDGPASCRHNVVSFQHQVVQRFLWTDMMKLSMQPECGLGKNVLLLIIKILSAFLGPSIFLEKIKSVRVYGNLWYQWSDTEKKNSKSD